MRVKEKERINRFISMGKVRGCTMIVRIPVRLGDSRYSLASVYAVDGKAIIVPSSLRCGILVLDWFRFMRTARTHKWF